jgi:hypothetical protein
MKNIQKLKVTPALLKHYKQKRCLVSVDYGIDDISEDLEKYRDWAVITLVTRDSIHVMPYSLTKDFKDKQSFYHGLSGYQIVKHYGDTEFTEYCRRLAECEVDE